MKKMTEKAMRHVNGGWWLTDWIRKQQAKCRGKYDALLEAIGE